MYWTFRDSASLRGDRCSVGVVAGRQRQLILA
jgi:hypothetical protein